MKIENIVTPSITAHRRIEVSGGPVLGDRRKYRVDKINVSYIWSAKEHCWTVQHIEVSGPVRKKDGTDALTRGTGMVWLPDAGEPWAEFRRIATNLAPVGDPALPGVLDA